MSSSNESTSLQTAAPEPAKTPTPETFARRLFRLDMILLGLVLVLAFFLGSFSANNSELYLHLGLPSPFANQYGNTWVHHAWLPSLVAQAIYQPYNGQAATGGAILVTLKALIVVLVAVVLCLIRRPGQGWLLPLSITALTMVVMSRRLNLEPSVISVLFLAVTLLILTLPQARFPRAIFGLPLLFLVWVNMDQWFVLGLIVVALWLIGEVLQGSLHMQSAGPPDPPRIKPLALVLAAGVLACFVNPWTYRAFTLPADLGYTLSDIMPVKTVGAGGVLRRMREADPDPMFLPQLSPFSSAYWSMAMSPAKTPVGLAYYLLLVVGLASFAAPAFFLRPPAASDAKNVAKSYVSVPLWLVFGFFALFSVFNSRIVHLFAVVAGPIAVLNWQDFLRRSRSDKAELTKTDINRAVTAHLLALVGAVVLLAAAWPGWLFGGADNWRATRHVSWDVVEDPGMDAAAKTIERIQEKTGRLQRGFNFTLDGGNFFTTNAFQDKGAVKLFADTRFDLPLSSADDYGSIRRSLQEDSQLQANFSRMSPDTQPRAWQRIQQVRAAYQQLLNQHKIDYVVFTRLGADPAAAGLAQFMTYDSSQWTLLYHDGRTAVFGWCGVDPHEPEPFGPYRLDLEWIAGPNVPLVKLAAEIAEPPSDATSEWLMYAAGPVRPGLDSFQALEFLTLFDQARNYRLSNGLTALVAFAGGATANVLWNKDKSLTYPIKDRDGKEVDKSLLMRPRDQGPPGALPLAVRAARNATVASPDDAEGHERLSRAYHALMELQEDYWVGRPDQVNATPIVDPYKPPIRRQLRTAQIMMAMRDAITARPDVWQIRYMFAQQLFQFRYFDMGQEQMSLAKASLEGKKFATREEADRAKGTMDEINAQLAKVREYVKANMEDFDVLSVGQPDSLEKFKLAILDPKHPIKDNFGHDHPSPRGLMLLGENLLNEVTIDKLKGDADKAKFYASWRLYIWLSTGRPREAMAWLKSNQSVLHKLLPAGGYEQFRAMAAGALGDYREADKYLGLAEKEAKKEMNLPSDEELIETQKQKMNVLHAASAANVAALPGPDGIVGAVTRLASGLNMWGKISQEVTQHGPEKRYLADLRLLRGVLALEAGDTSAAATYFEGSLRIAGNLVDFPDRRIAERYLEQMRDKR